MFVFLAPRTMAQADPLWRAPRIHGELLKLGIKVSERTVSRILPSVQRPPSQTWKTFLRNHRSAGQVLSSVNQPANCSEKISSHSSCKISRTLSSVTLWDQQFRCFQQLVRLPAPFGVD